MSLQFPRAGAYQQSLAAVWLVFTSSVVGPHHVAKCERAEQDRTSRDTIQLEIRRSITTSSLFSRARSSRKECVGTGGRRQLWDVIHLLAFVPRISRPARLSIASLVFLLIRGKIRLPTQARLPLPVSSFFFFNNLLSSFPPMPSLVLCHYSSFCRSPH